MTGRGRQAPTCAGHSLPVEDGSAYAHDRRGEQSVSRRPMGSLEAAVLEVLWDSDDAMKPGDVLDQLELEPAVTYSTVLTILRRLWKKGLVTRKKDGKAYLYHPTRSREEQVAQTMAEAFSAANDPAAAVGHFVEQLSSEQASVLKRALGRRR